MTASAMIRTAVIAALIVGGATTSIAVAPAFAAATPPGCTQTWSTPYVSSGGLIRGSGTGSCQSVGSRTFKLELVHDFSSPWPDVVVVTAADGGYKIKYSTSYAVCDNGGTTTYYNHAFFSGYAGGVSPRAAFAHC